MLRCSTAPRQTPLGLFGWVSLVLVACFSTAAASPPSLAPRAACTIHWAAAAGGLWNAPGSWAEQRVPVRTDHVCIQAAGTYGVRLSEYAEAGSLSIGGPASAATLTVVRGGFLVLDSLVVATEGTLAFDGGGAQIYDRATVDGTLEMGNGANVYGTAAFRIAGRLVVPRAATAYWVGKQLDVSGHLDLYPRSFLEVRSRGVDASRAARAETVPTPGDSILPALHLRATSALRLFWGDTLSAGVSGRVNIIGDAVVDGALAVERGAGTRLSAGDEYPFLEMRWDSLQGGFTRTSGLDDPATGLSLAIEDRDPPTETVQFVLRAGLPRTLQALSSVRPSLVASGATRLLRLHGQGLHAPMEAWLACTSCHRPDLFSRLDGRVQSANDTSATVSFNLSDPRIAGAYRLSLRDASGTTVSVPLAIASGPLRLSIHLLDPETTEGSSQVARAVIRNTWPPYEAQPIPMDLSGTATLNEDYGVDVLPGELVLPQGQDSVVVSVFALRDALQEGVEYVTITIPAANGAPGQANILLRDAPAEATPYAATVSPSQLGVGGRATVQLLGEGLTADLTVHLEGEGAPALAASAVQSEQGGRTLFASFDLRPSAAPAEVLTLGPRRVVVRGRAGAVVASFPIALVRPQVANVSLSLDLPPRILRGRATPVTIVVRNLGNVDLTGSPLLFGVPAGTEWSHDPAHLTLPAGATWASLWPAQPDGDFQSIRLPQMRLPPRSTRRLEVYLTFPSQLTARLAAAWESY